MFGTRPLTPNSAGITGPMNINAVIAHLVEMTPPQRKQFAQMHMDDPMMLSAAKFVDNQISKQAAAQAAQQTGAAPPPVNRQVVAQMSPQPPAPQAAPQPQAAQQPQGQPMPEDTGIAQLPAPNMPSEYAAGGIVAFGVGGPVDPKIFADYLQSIGKTTSDFANALPQERAAIQQGYDAVRNAANAGPQRLPAGAAPTQAAAAAEQPGMGYRLGQMARQGLNRVGSVISEGMPRLGIGALAALTAGNENQNTREDEIMAAIHGESYKGKPYNKKDAEALLKEMNVPGVKLKETAAPPAKAKNDRTPRDPANYAPAEAPKEKTGIDQLRQEKIPATQAIPPSAAEKPSQDLSLDRFMPAGAKRPGESDVEAMNRERLKGAEEALSGFNADLAKRGKAMEGQETRIAAREATAKDRLDTNTNMSLINAGLAMMQSTGKGLAGIAEGAQVGTKQYQAGLREYDSAQEKFDAARDMIEQYRRTEDTMNDKERRALTKDINTTRASGIESMINFRTKIYGEDRADARSLLDMTVKQQEAAADRAARERLHAMTEAGANTRAAISERNAAARMQMLTGNDRTAQLIASGTPQGEQVKKGLQQLADMQAGKFNIQSKYAEYVHDWTKAGGAVNGPKMSMAEYAGQFQGPKLVELPPSKVKP